MADRKVATPAGAAEFGLGAEALRAAESYREAISQYESALLAPEVSLEEQLELAARLADSHLSAGNYQSALDVATKYLEKAPASLWTARMLSRLGWASLHLGELESSIASCEEAVRLLSPSDQHAEFALALRRLGYAIKWRGSVESAHEHFRDSLAAARRSRDDEQIALSLTALANTCRLRGRYHDALRFHEQCVAINERRGSRYNIARDLLGIGLSSLYVGDWPRAAAALDRASQVCQEGPFPRGLLLVDLTLCRLHRRRGETTTAVQFAERALVRAQETSDARAEVLSYEELGDLAWESDRAVDAGTWYEKGWQLAESIAPEGDLVYELAWRRARVALATSRVDEAEALARKAAELAERNGDSREVGNALRILSRIQYRRGDIHQGVTSLEGALEKARSIQAPYEMAEAHEVFAGFAGPDGPITASAALAHLFEARRFFTQLGARAAIARVELEIARFEHLILDENDASRSSDSPANANDGQPIVRDAGMIQLVARATELASTDATVLLQGATGTGKEVIARIMHDRGPRSAHPFLALNCAALPTHLLESELFGHRRGSFTGADQDRVGLFEAAGEGTVFLDEIDKASPEFQTKLLRVIEDRRVRPVGTTRETPVLARILCAANRDLKELAESGRFLPDLLYRLAAFRLVIPPLRERPDDLWAMVDHYLANAAVRFGARRYRLTPEARAAIAAYEWPGNVRELKNVLEAAAFFSRRTGQIDRVDLPSEIGGANGGAQISLTERIETLERREIELALRRARGNKTVAAQALRVSRKGLLDRLRRLGL